MILESRESRGIERARVAELLAIRAELGREGHAASLSYIARVLRDAGVPVDYEDRYGGPPLEEPYATELRGLLRFGSLRAAEETLRRAELIRREYDARSDHQGLRFVHSFILRGKLRAESLAASAHVSAEKRREKAEIASWFGVWLEAPNVFFEWLEVRKESKDFREMFGTGVG